MDRVPLEQAVDKPEPERAVDESKVREVATGQGITEMKDLASMASLFGFTQGFDGEGKKAEAIYAWAKEKLGLSGGPDVILLLKDMIRFNGFSGTGKHLLDKIFKWAMLDTSIKDIRKRQEILSEH